MSNSAFSGIEVVKMSPETQATLVAQLEPGQIANDVSFQGQSFQAKYPTAVAVIQRLNKAFGHVWSHEIVGMPWHSPDNAQVLVKVGLEVHVTAAGNAIKVRKEAIGQCKLRTMPGTNGASRLENYGYDVKAAVTDGLRKAATEFGIALDLYSRDEAPFQGGDKAVVPQQNMSAPAPSFQIAHCVRIFESGEFPGLNRAQWLNAIGVQSPEAISIAVALQIIAGTQPYLVHIRNGRVVPMAGAVSSENA